jgi:hypothetical protein
MIDYMVAMVIQLLILGLIFLGSLFTQSGAIEPVYAQDILVVIYAPLPGQAVQGQIPVDIGVAAPGYARVELQFTYFDSDTNTWFLIAETDQIPFDGVIAHWDTTSITDGEYDLRLVAFKSDGESTTYIVPGLRVRNYSPIETNTPTPILPTMTLLPGQFTPQASETATPPAPTITPFPTNPAIFTESQLAEGVTLGGTIVLAAFAVFGVYIALSNIASRK